MILPAVLPSVAISYIGMPSLYWAHTENGSLCLRSSLPLRPPFYALAARRVRQLKAVLTGLSVRQSVKLRAEFDRALDDAAESILVRALSALAHAI
jgi:hypothetical protein